MDSLPSEIPCLLFVFPGLAFGEDEQLAIEDVFELHHRGLSWRAVCVAGSEIHSRLKLLAGENLITIDSPLGQNLDRRMRDLLRGLIEKGEIGLIHWFGTDRLGSLLPWMLAHPTTPVVVSEGPQVEKRLSHFFQSFFYSRIDAILVPSSTLKRRVLQMRPSLSGRIRTVHPGLDFNIFNPDHFDFKLLRHKWGIDPDRHLVGMIASREYVKAQAAFIKAAASFLRNEELAARTRFVIVGFEHEGNEGLITLIRQFHLQDHIILAPAETSLPKVLGSLDVYVLPSSKALFGLQAIESLAMGTPIICAAGPDSNEWTANSQAGLVMRSGDSFDLQRKLRMMLEDPEELARMGQRSVQYARENYDRGRRTDRLCEIYRRVRERRAKALTE